MFRAKTVELIDSIVLDSTKANYTWPLKKTANMDGEITLGGLHMIHERNADLICGPIMAQGGIQAMETMLFTIDHINKQPWWIKNITLGKYISVFRSMMGLKYGNTGCGVFKWGVQN